MSNEFNKRQLERALDNFQNAFTELNRVWDLDGNDEIMANADYPFEHGFERTTREVMQWVDQAKENCRRD